MKILSVYTAIVISTALTVTSAGSSQIDPAYAELSSLCVYTEAHSADSSVARVSETPKESELASVIRSRASQKGWEFSIKIRNGCWEPTPKQMTLAYFTALRRDPLNEKRVITASWFGQSYEVGGLPRPVGPVEIKFCDGANLSECIVSQAAE